LSKTSGPKNIQATLHEVTTHNLGKGIVDITHLASGSCGKCYLYRFGLLGWVQSTDVTWRIKIKLTGITVTCYSWALSTGEYFIHI